MTHTPHELHEEFPDHAERIHELKVGNNHFARLSEDYHQLNRQIHRIETNIEPSDDIPASHRSAAPCGRTDAASLRAIPP